MTISLIRTLILYFVILVGMRLMGKRQISELQTSELVVTLLISDIAAIPMQDTDQPLVSGLLPILVLIAVELFLSFAMMRSRRFRRLLCGSPIVLIENGKLNQQKMRELRITIEDLWEELRQKDIFALSDVAYAIVETNGTMSIIKKPEKEVPTVSMLKISNTEPLFEAVVIHDGTFSSWGLSLCGKTQEWVEAVLRQENTRREEIFLMTATPQGGYTLVKKEDNR